MAKKKSLSTAKAYAAIKFLVMTGFDMEQTLDNI